MLGAALTTAGVEPSQGGACALSWVGSGSQEDTRGSLRAQSHPHCPRPDSGHGGLLAPLTVRLPAGQPLSLPRTLLTPAQVRRVLGHLSPPAPPGPGQQVDVLGNSSLPSEGLKE